MILVLYDSDTEKRFKMFFSMGECNRWLEETGRIEGEDILIIDELEKIGFDEIQLSYFV